MAVFCKSKILGKFHGWEDSIRYELQNGQVWQQLGDASFHYDAYEPEVTIIQIADGFFMKVAGCPCDVGVIRVH